MVLLNTPVKYQLPANHKPELIDGKDAQLITAYPVDINTRKILNDFGIGN